MESLTQILLVSDGHDVQMSVAQTRGKTTWTWTCCGYEVAGNPTATVAFAGWFEHANGAEMPSTPFRKMVTQPQPRMVVDSKRLIFDVETKRVLLGKYWAEVEKETGVSDSAIIKLMRGDRNQMRLSTAEPLCKWLGRSVAEYLVPAPSIKTRKKKENESPTTIASDAAADPADDPHRAGTGDGHLLARDDAERPAAAHLNSFSHGDL